GTQRQRLFCPSEVLPYPTKREACDMIASQPQRAWVSGACIESLPSSTLRIIAPDCEPRPTSRRPQRCTTCLLKRKTSSGLTLSSSKRSKAKWQMGEAEYSVSYR